MVPTKRRLFQGPISVKKNDYISSSSTTSYKGPTVRFLRGVWVISEKISCRLISREKMSWKEIHGEKYPALKKSLSWCILESYTIIFPGKISRFRGLGKRFSPKPNHRHPTPTPQKSNGRPLSLTGISGVIFVFQTFNA